MQLSKFLFLILFLFIFSLSIFGQIATKAEIKTDENSYNGGKLIVNIGGKKRNISDGVRDFWIVNKGKEVVYSINEMTRGFEGEGESLFIYDVKTGKTRKIMAEYSFVTGLSEVKLSNGAGAFLISMGDGGLGGSYFAVVDPKRGQVLHLNFAELLEVKGDKVKLAIYKTDDWEIINEERNWDETKSQSAFAKPTKVKPEKTETLDLNNILKNKVIVNKTNEELGREYEKKYTNLTIYQWRPKDKDPEREYFLMAVGKEFPKTISPLRTALESLFTDTTENEKKDGWESAVFGMKFEDVVLNNGVATIKFSQPKSKREMPKFAPQMFLEAVQNTAKQFKTVKIVNICEVGGTTNAFDVTPQIPKCLTN